MIQPATLIERKATGGQENGTYFNRNILYFGIDDDAAKWTMENLQLTETAVVVEDGVDGDYVAAAISIIVVQWTITGEEIAL